ncbi:MAG TPA: GAF domain-containing protein, partial [Gemmatimonadales bacterium]|nr:GAF domain-containing protein [Gemmatimonadales bacterium]
MTALLLAALGVVLLGGGWLLGRRFAGRRDDAETARLRAELSRKISENFSLQELSYVLADSLHLDRIAGQVTGFLRRFFDAGGSLIALVAETPGSVRIAAAEGTLAPLAGRDVTETEAGLLGAAMGREQIELAEGDGARTVELIAGVSVERAAVIPLRAHGMTVGAIAVVDRPAGAFSADELRLLSTVATHAAIVLSNARFFDLVRAGRDQWETTFNALAEGIAVVDQG